MLILFACLCLASVATPTFARITTASIDADSRSSIPLSRAFGFAAGGEPFLQFNVSDFQVWAPHTNVDDVDSEKCFGFYLATPLYDNLDPDAPEGQCWPEGASPGLNVKRLDVTFEDLISPEKDDDGNEIIYSYTEADTRKLVGGLHTLYFVNCCFDKFKVSFDIVTDMYNTIRGEKTYLSVGEIELPTLYMIMSILFAIGLAIWGYTVYVHQRSARRIHYMMIVLGAFKVLTLLAQCGMYHYIRVTGHPDGWNVAYYIFTFFRSIFLFSIIILIGTGWSYMTPFLGDNEKRVLMIVLPFQVLIDVAIVINDEFTPAAPSWLTWRDLMHFMDIICCCAILFPIAWRIRHLREASATDGKAERSMQQLIMFRHFYIMVVVYVYFTRIVVYLLEAALPADLVWLSAAAEELATLTFYTLTAAQFRPHGSNSYTKLVSEAEIEMSSV